MLSERIQKIQPSATLAINAKAIELKKQGVDILKFGTGEPDFDTPENIKDAAKINSEADFYELIGDVLDRGLVGLA